MGELVSNVLYLMGFIASCGDYLWVLLLLWFTMLTLLYVLLLSALIYSDCAISTRQ